MCDVDHVSLAKLSPETGLAWAVAAEIRAVSRRLKVRLREQGGGNDLTPSQVSVVLRLEGVGSATVSSLARAEGMRPQSMSAIVTLLQEAGLAGSTADPNDGRQTLISLTSKCREWLEEGRAARQDWLATTISQKLSVPEQKTLQAAFKMLARLLEE